MGEVKKRKSYNYWTKPLCHEEALKYSSRLEFSQKCSSAYRKALKNNWLDEICSHMDMLIKPVGYWDSYENCKNEALKYETRIEFKTKSRVAYNVVGKKGWKNELCSHMKVLLKPVGYWQDKKTCHEEALKYKTRTEFQKKASGAYDSALNNGWLNEICSHMKTQGNRIKRLIYIYEFPDNNVYIGLTYNIEERNWVHLNRGGSAIYKYIKKTGLIPKLSYGEYIDVNEAQILEHETKLEYIKNGYNVLNTGATGEGIGSLGGNILKWIKEKCQEEALKYKTRSEFQKKAGGAYNAAWKNKWLDEICAHMISPQKPSGYWTKERLQKEALKYKTRTEFFKKSSSAYDVSRKNGWLDEFCVHMETFSKPKGHWNNKENCRLEALKYKTRTEFSKKSICSYESSSKNKWLDEFFPK